MAHSGRGTSDGERPCSWGSLFFSQSCLTRVRGAGTGYWPALLPVAGSRYRALGLISPTVLTGDSLHGTLLQHGIIARENRLAKWTAV